MSIKKFCFSVLLVFSYSFSIAQNVPILDYSVNSYGQVQLEIAGQSDKYYTLTTLHEPDLDYQSITSVTRGIDGNMIISEPLAAFGESSYQITAHDISAPGDIDGDGVDDITELNDMPNRAPLNFSDPIPFIDGSTSIDSRETYLDLAVIYDDIPWAPFLNNQAFVKFAILNQETDEPRIYFINSNTHYIHADFLGTINTQGTSLVSGEVVYNPNEILPNGAIGSYSFNYSFGFAYDFEQTRRTFELLAANMPYLRNNFQHFIGSGGETNHINLYRNDFVGSRINVTLESDVFEDVDFLPFHQAEGFGFFRVMGLDENPGSRDIVLYDALPNSLPRVGGIITSVVQTPLSHVNLRAIQDDVPNAYIAEPLMIDSIADLVGKYIYYKVEQDKYTIREASLEEVNAWYENIRPTEPQIPDRDLSFQSIRSLDDIDFSMSTAFGAKCSNVATMRTFGFPDGTIPYGFGVPFYYYDEFMKFNGFYDQVEEMISNPQFITDLETRIDMLSDFRKVIRAADMPQWMLDSLQVMHESFPVGQPVRCRSSTNNEDLPGFSGAGLYTSKTQYPDEGHISKSIKQVYASMWNFRAFDERDFYRIDHFIAAMGVLCHPNYNEEKSNGVGVSIDPIYQTANTFYLNTQVGEFLITNPDANSIPEEILLYEDPAEGYFVLRNSNLVPDGELVMEDIYIAQLRTYLKVIHDEFAELYDVVGAEGFGMDIEYKVTREDQLIIKQARPWVSFWANIKADSDLGVLEVVDPQSAATLTDTELVKVQVKNSGLKALQDFELLLFVDEQPVDTIMVLEELASQQTAEYEFETTYDFSAIAEYSIKVVVTHPADGYSKNDTLTTIVSQLHALEAGLIIGEVEAQCGSAMDIRAIVTNYGATTFNETQIEVNANGEIVDTFVYSLNIPYQATVGMTIRVAENLLPSDNEIELRLLAVNGQPDAISNNNSAMVNADLDSDFDFVTLIIDADNYPQEISWSLQDLETGQVLGSGDLSQGDDIVTEEICFDYSTCATLFVSDSAGDGICCGFGIGDFTVLNSSGDTLVYNDGEYGSSAEEEICPSFCGLTAEFTSQSAATDTTADGQLSIVVMGGVPPYQYSIDGGLTYSSESVFLNLLAQEYAVVVKDVNEDCLYRETVTVEADVLISTYELSEGTISIYPNPATGLFTVQLQKSLATSAAVRVEVYSTLGVLIEQKYINTTAGEQRAQFSLQDYPSGSYIVKCHSDGYEKYFNLIKI